MNNTQKKSYEAPQLKKVGSFEAVTQGSNGNIKLDMTYTVGTLITDLTFS